MNLEFLRNMSWFRAQRSNDLGPILKPSSAVVEQGHQHTCFDIRIWGFSLLSLLPWETNANANAREDIILTKTTINRNLKRQVKRGRAIENRGGETPLRFKPYVCKVPWHTGVRAFLSQLFPRYGHYCGPNWSSGKDNGSLVWDKRPIDWLDFCCYCHDIGYDTHNQAELLKADLAFLECLERPNMVTKGDAHVATVYRTMCVTGLKNLLIPYRRQLIQLQTFPYQPAIQFGWLSNVKWFSWNWQRAEQKHPKM
ncbi:uncharacterized protein LOC120087580 isoform X1 [Benincasa hispida]|uniref:uncharacterized protein LOC120087580 isoform X1 n=1 Tax=Benincasa hispida TaxID=102211 RepID=UPI0019029DA5|nr:uncharacterized protein LOC120087580 isoform X1 [Benincasa hispida]